MGFLVAGSPPRRNRLCQLQFSHTVGPCPAGPDRRSSPDRAPSDYSRPVRTALVFILTLVLPSVLLSAFAFQAVEAERRLRLAQEERALQRRAESVVRELDEVLRDACRRIAVEVGKLRDLRRPEEAGPRLVQALPREALVDGVLVLDRGGHRVWPVGRPSPAPRVRSERLGAGLGGALGACLAHEPGALLELADAVGPGDRDGALAILERVARGPYRPAVRAAALWDLGRQHQAGANLPGTLNALEAYRELSAFPLGLIDARGRPSAAQARLREALVSHLLRNRAAFADGLRRLLSELEEAPEQLPVDVLTDLAERAAMLLAEDGQGEDERPRARVLAERRRLQEQVCLRIEDLFAASIRRMLRDEPARQAARGEAALFKERGAERELLVAVSPLPAARAGAHSPGLVVLALAEEPLLRVCRERVARAGQAELIPWGRAARVADPTVQEVALRPPLEHLGVRVRASGDEPELVEPLGLPGDTVRLWAIALSLAGILGGIVVTVRTVRRESKAAQLKSDWVSNVTHELKTPLTSIRMFLETLQLGRVTDEAEAKECLQVMSRETERLTRMIEQLLAFSRIESKKMRLRLAFVTPRALVDEALGVLADQLGKPLDGLGIEVVGVQDLPEIAVDRIAVVEAILNLLHNAWKYSPGADRKVRVVLAARRRVVEIAVEDNGIGVPRRDRRRIFVKFERGSNAEQARIEGSGIGLTVADTIARAHGGRVEYSPLRPKGSRFSIFLPK